MTLHLLLFIIFFFFGFMRASLHFYVLEIMQDYAAPSCLKHIDIALLSLIKVLKLLNKLEKSVKHEKLNVYLM